MLSSVLNYYCDGLRHCMGSPLASAAGSEDSALACTSPPLMNKDGMSEHKQLHAAHCAWAAGRHARCGCELQPLC